MGLFSRTKTAVAVKDQAPSSALLDSGRRFTTSLALLEVVARVQELVDSYAPRQYPTLPHMVPAGFTWSGPTDETPSAVYLANIAMAAHPGDYLVISLRPNGAGTEIGVFPQGVGDARLAIPFAGNLKMLDSSLSSIGTISGGLLGLDRPPVAPDLVDRTLEIAGYPTSDDNRALVADQFFAMTQIKANQYLDAVERPDAAGRSADWRARAQFGPTMVEPMEMVLVDLARRGPGQLPLIQDMPLRVQSVTLEAADRPGTFWDRATQR